MSKQFDALYGGILDDVLTKDVEPVIPKANEVKRIVAVLKSRAEGYFDRARQFEKQGEQADCEAAMGTCRELAYVAKMLEEGRLEELEAKG
jgi:hypothetical protein